MYGTIEHSSSLRQCLHGHAVGAGVTICPRCGAPVQDSAASFLMLGPHDEDGETEEITAAVPHRRREAAKKWRLWRR